MTKYIAVMVVSGLLSAPALADTLIVANKYEGTLSFIDLETGEEVARPRTGASPHEVALSPDERTVVVVSYLEDGYVGRELNVFDVETAELLKTIEIAPHLAPHGIEWLGDSDSVIVTTEETRDVIRVNVDTGEVTGVAETGEVGSHLLALSPDASRAYVTSRGSSSISVVDTDVMAVLDTVPADIGPEAVFVSPDGSELWVGNNQSETITIFDPLTMERMETLDMGFLPIRVRFAPAGDVVAVADLRGHRVVILDADTREEVAVVDLGAHGIEEPASLFFSADGASLYAGSQASSTVVEIDTATWQLRRQLAAGDGADGLEISAVKTALTI